MTSLNLAQNMTNKREKINIAACMVGKLYE